MRLSRQGEQTVLEKTSLYNLLFLPPPTFPAKLISRTDVFMVRKSTLVYFVLAGLALRRYRMHFLPVVEGIEVEVEVDDDTTFPLSQGRNACSQAKKRIFIIYYLRIIMTGRMSSTLKVLTNSFSGMIVGSSASSIVKSPPEQKVSFSLMITIILTLQSALMSKHVSCSAGIKLQFSGPRGSTASTATED